LLALALLSTAVFTISHVIGVNVTDPVLSKHILMANLSVMFITCFVAHFIFIFIGKEKEQKPAIIAIYTITLVMLTVYLIFPDTFLLDSVPKLYFPNYYVAGSLDWIMRIVSVLIIPIYFFIHTILAYKTADSVLQNRIKYFASGLVFGYFFGWLATPLVFFDKPILFGIILDPVYSLPFIPIFALTFTYAALKYELVDIKIVAKQAFIYAITTTVVGMAIAVFNAFNAIIRTDYPSIPSWLIPFVSSVIAVTAGAIVWKKLRESDALKYEFITVVTHKFRGPLTQIKWLAESITDAIPEEAKPALDQIQSANYRLIEMTNLLVRVSETDNSEYSYHYKPIRLGKIINELMPEYRGRAELKKLKLAFNDDSVKILQIDATKMKFVFQILLDNAIIYTPEGGSITVTTHDESNGGVLLTVKDSGIGIANEDASRIFQKFWRSQSALHADVNGMGIGLFMARNIIERHGGTIRASSEGLNRGTTFSVLFKK
jgi:signal transduction histidine kinase